MPNTNERDALTDEQIQALWDLACKDSPQKPGWCRHIRFARSVLAATAPNAGAPLADPLKVACITLDGSTLTIEVELIGRVLAEFEAGETYALSFKTMTRAEYEALGDFNGF